MEKFLDQENLSAMKEAFAVFDQNGDGHISNQELSTVLTTMNHGTPPDPSMLQNMIAELDIDGNGTVELEEFLQWSMRNKGQDSVQQLRGVFDVFDKNKDGYIDTNELAQVMSEMGERLEYEEIIAMMKDADLDQDGLISFQEFTILMTGQGKQDFLKQVERSKEEEVEERRRLRKEKKERREKRKEEKRHRRKDKREREESEESD